MLIVQTHRRPPVTAMVVAALVVVAAVVVWLAAATPDSPDLPSDNAPAAATARTGAPAIAPVAPAGLSVPAGPTEPPPDDPARVFDLGIAGGLLIDGGTVTALDRLQSMVGENPTPEELAALERKLREGLPREDAEKAIKLFNGYRGYTKDLQSEIMSMGMPDTQAGADALMARMTAVQREHFDPAAADAMFAEQNRVSKVVLDAAIVQNDPNLTDAQKKTRLDTMRASLPDDQRHVVPDLPAPAASAAP